MDIKINSDLNKILLQLSTKLTNLSSGKRINKASDDAAGLAIVAALEADTAALGVANRNVRDGQSLVAIADGAASQISSLETRRAELATQAANGTNSEAQRQALDAEFQELGKEIDRIAATTEFNGQNPLQGQSVNIQAGTGSDADSQISIDGISVSSQNLSIATEEGAKSAIDATGSQIENLASQRAQLGAAESRLSVAFERNSTTAENEAAAASRIADADIAKETAELVSLQIRSQSALAVGAQANLNEKNVLKLLGN